jgi:hypothetical protein
MLRLKDILTYLATVMLERLKHLGIGDSGFHVTAE